MDGRTFSASSTFPQVLLHPSRPNLFSAASSRVKIYSFPQISLDNPIFARGSAKGFCLRATGLNDEESNCPLIKFPPSIWGDYFLAVPVNDWELRDQCGLVAAMRALLSGTELHALAREIDALKPRVRDALVSSHGDAKEKIYLIYSLVCLGLSNHFENEIEENLNRAFEEIQDLITDEYDLSTISIIFRVFRLYGHNMSCDVFNRFKGDDGKFKGSLVKDVMGMLSLYEAAHLGTTAEDIMDEALSFTLKHLESLAVHASPPVSRLIQNALYQPQHHNIEILVAREYIPFYEHEKDHNEMLLKFAKLNFNFLQLHYIRELKSVTKWWKDLDLMAQLPYIRDRMVESYFWAIGIYFKPQYSLARIILAKFIMVLAVMDDTYDAYGSLPEVISFTDALERWSPDTIDKLPEYLKIIYRFLLDVFKEFDREVGPEGMSYSVQETIKGLKRLLRANLAIAKWSRRGRVPHYEEYMEVGQVTSAVDLFVGASFIGMGETAGKEAYDWLKSRPKIIQALNTKGRLRDDMATYKHEMSRGEVASGINCYMKQYGVTEEEAFGEFQRRLKDTNKRVNGEFFKTTAVPRQLLLRVLNVGRIIDVNYKYGDGFTYPKGKIKEQITSLFVDPIPL